MLLDFRDDSWNGSSRLLAERYHIVNGSGLYSPGLMPSRSESGTSLWELPPLADSRREWSDLGGVFEDQVVPGPNISRREAASHRDISATSVRFDLLGLLSNLRHPPGVASGERVHPEARPDAFSGARHAIAHPIAREAV